ncbi:MAG: response regulator transcription factor [Clostridiales bacterium]|nr:response regulator transcription factor [Clostridiales bacterium]
MAQNKILLVDDDTDILEINRAFLEGEGYEIVTATNIAETMEKVQTHNFDCIVLDVMLPDGSAFELPPRIQVYSDAPIIFLTAREQVEDKITGFKSGADDYITKPYSLPELSLRINAHIKRSMKSEGFLMEFTPLKINIKTREVLLKDTPVHLTNREFDILRLLAETPNVIVPFSRIYSHVWGDDTPCDNHLVMVNISYLRKKMEKIAPEITFVKTEWGIGYSFAYPPVKNSMSGNY